uniref:Chloride channel protein n=1 Tax=Plectus sambesii TaxID=2011161 RepID=A0A914W741_9BILA
MDSGTSSTSQSTQIRTSKCHSFFQKCNWRTLRHVIIEDWSLTACLGIIMAFLSFTMDLCIEYIEDWHDELLSLSKNVPSATSLVTFITWTSYTLLFVITSTVFVRFVAPQAIGSGIPEMKAIISGTTILKEYLSLKTMIAKCVGMTLSLGSGLPIGKEGPFVHVASTVAVCLSKLTFGWSKNHFPQEVRYTEVLATACAVGVACTFSAPVGGVLFSIEVTSAYFAKSNYWRGFFAATCCAGVLRLLRVQLPSKDDFLVAFYQTHYPPDSVTPEQLPAFALLGLVCGLAGALFISCHRNFVLSLKNNKFTKRVNEKSFIIIPVGVTFLIAALTFPLGYGKYIVGHLKHRDALAHFFHKCTWSVSDESHPLKCGAKLLHNWTADGTVSIFVTLSLFVVAFFLLTILCNAIPIPAGQFMPVFVIGAAFGRLIGELMVTAYHEDGSNQAHMHIVPGVYSVVCAAAFCGAVTHTVSVSVIVIELTGQNVFILPVLIAVLIANAVCSYFQPSIYESISKIKGLQQLPPLPATSSKLHDIQAKQIMVHNVKFITRSTTYRQLKEMVSNSIDIEVFPIVNDPDSKILIGSVTRSTLREIWSDQVIASMTEQQLKQSKKRKRSKTWSKISPASSNESTSIHTSQSLPKLSKSSLIDSSSFPKGGEDFSAQRYVKHFVQSLSLSHWKRGSSHKQFEWELSEERLDQPIHLDEQRIDSTPFQLVAQTSLFKMHSLFCLLGLSRAFVTDCGRLRGVVALKEIKSVIENGVSPVTSVPPSRKVTIATITASIRKSSIKTGNQRKEPAASKWSDRRVSVVPELDETGIINNATEITPSSL